MPAWLEILFGAVPGSIGLLVAIFHMGALRRDVHDLIDRSKGWDQAKSDLSYIKGRFEESDVSRLTPKRPRLRAVSGSGQLE